MKKRFVLLLVLFFSVCASAQWKVEEMEADELKGIPASKCYSYTDAEGNTFAFFSTSRHSFVIIAKEGVFNFDTQRFVKVYSGFYTPDGKLNKKMTRWFPVRTDKDASSCYNNAGGSWIGFLTKEKGYIRMVIPRFRKEDLDFIVPCINGDIEVNFGK